MKMFPFVTSLWNYISMAGTETAHTKREENIIVQLNRAWLFLVVIQLGSLISHILHGSHRTAVMTGLYLLGLALVHVLIQKGKVNAGKITAILVINANTLAMAYLLGEHTHIIDFLLLTAIIPLYLFETRQRKLIFMGITLSIFPYAFYHYTVFYLRAFELPLADQMILYNTTTWVMVFSLTALLFLVFRKNTIYEEDTQEKEKQLTDQRKLYERILEQIPVSIATFDKQLCYTYVNSAAINDPQVREWIIGKRNEDYFREYHLDLKMAEARDKILIASLQKEDKIETEEIFIDNLGQVRHSLKGISPVYSDDDKELLCLISYSTDITGIKEAEQKQRAYAKELERKNEDLQHFVNVTSHDLKSPLRTIASYLQLIERKNKQLLDEDSLSLIATTINSVKHLNQLISDIYLYSVADRHDAPDETANFNEVLKSILIQMSQTISAKNALIKYSPLPILKMSPSHVGIIFSNLLNNSLKYCTSHQPSIAVDWEESEENYTITYSDNGIGIPEQYRLQIFEIFKRLHHGGEYEGTGVGLAVCKKIVESYGGQIWVESESGRGSVFYIRLPKSVVSLDTKKISTPPDLAIAG